ncbi:Probable galactinol--sucrose galactosyltransferase 6 (Protein DARK INDUCIBLE 10) (Raffinose synthase 6) [Durusdinium trenchii]|uniref:galactinol--sucrose galactosyltransferase n=1 Tax=Durusdinium trenchii TaxID=1381693 RepID=A0ABP0S472_9DINO
MEGWSLTSPKVAGPLIQGHSIIEESFELYPDRALDQLLCLHRHKPPWTAPALRNKLSEIPPETLFVLARSSSGTLLLCPLAHRGSSSSCCLRGSARGLDDFELVSLRDSSCTAALLLLALELPPHVMASTAASWAAERVAARVGGARLRREKRLPSLFTRWGWCSWDAHGVQVQRWQLEAMSKHHPAWMVLDDGWQEEVRPEEWRQWLHTPQSRFGAKDFDLKELTSQLSKDSIKLLVWHTLLGYWGGVAPERGFRTRNLRPWWPSGLREGCPGEVDVWEGDFSPLEKEDFLRFYREFYETLASAGVAGVKCDGQFLAEVLVGPSGAQELAAAQEKALAAFGPSDVPVISCMSMTLPMVHGGSAVLARVSDDHAYPGVPEDAASVARHIWHCSTNSIWLAPFVHCDWDMLKTSEWHGTIHAVARAVAGCPVYTSDPAEHFNLEILRPLLLPGSDQVCPCLHAGLPIDRQIFQDPTVNRRPWWLLNSTAGGFMAAAFGLCDTGAEEMTETLYPLDCHLVKEHACLQVSLEGLGHAAPFSDAGWDVRMHYMGFAVLALAPILDFGEHRVAIFGLSGLWNPTGSLLGRWTDPEGLHVQLHCAGQLLLWSSGTFQTTIDGQINVDGTSASLQLDGLTPNQVCAGPGMIDLEVIRARYQVDCRSPSGECWKDMLGNTWIKSRMAKTGHQRATSQR